MTELFPFYKGLLTLNTYQEVFYNRSIFLVTYFAHYICFNFGLINLFGHVHYFLCVNDNTVLNKAGLWSGLELKLEHFVHLTVQPSFYQLAGIEYHFCK